MCGISGFNWPSETLIREMKSRISHRGPDDEGELIDQQVSLGHTRLSIIDLSTAGHQPMCNEDETIWIVYNGEIYNFQEIKNILLDRGHIFRSRTDTEVIIHAYEEYGKECIKLFNGMWSFCIYDQKESLLFLSRDRFGIKPLYYYDDGERFIFSSEIKGILVHDILKEPNEGVIFDYLFYNLLDHQEETFFANIKRVQPSFNLIFNLNTKKLTHERYYNLEDECLDKQEEFQKSGLRDLFLDSVNKMLVADVPVGCCLSGGIDSSAIVACMRHLNPDINIRTFSLIFPGKKIDESKYQQEMISRIDAEAYCTEPGPDDLLADLRDLVVTQEEPFATTSVYGQYTVMKLARQKDMKVLLDGQGADEIFAGYHYYFGYLFYEQLIKRSYWRLINELKDCVSNYNSLMPLIYLVLRAMPDFMKNNLYLKSKRPYFTPDFLHDNLQNRYDERWHINSIQEALIKSVTTYSLPHLLRFEDKNSMRFSIESRVPFLDHRLVEYALASPLPAKVCNGITKYGFRQAMEGILPEIIRNRKDKIGFAVPESGWMVDEHVQTYIFDIINSKKFKSRPYWRSDNIKNVYENMVKGKLNDYYHQIFSGTEIWRYLNLELWFNNYLD